MRILVVEDDLESQRYLVKGLKEAGHVVDDAADGETRAHAARQDRVHLPGPFNQGDAHDSHRDDHHDHHRS